MNDKIILKNISKSFGGNHVLEDLSLEFEPGTIACIEGPSGCGKTTLLRILAGLEVPDSGTVEKNYGTIGFVFQEDRLAEDFSAAGNIRMVTGKKLPDEMNKKHLEGVGLAEAEGVPVRDFSGGMKRRVAIVRAICFGADVLMMDEPFKGLDSELKIKVMDYVKKYSSGRTLIFVTHDHFEAEYMGGKAVTLNPASAIEITGTD